jgi:release factor H-coupled RctB family protein
MDTIVTPAGRATYIANPEVWLEGEAIAQLQQTAADSDCHCAVGMPDLHPGPGYPIGAAFGFSETVRPHLVGSDAGCGALVVALGKIKFGTAVARRLRAEFESDPLEGVDREALVRSVWSNGARGLIGHGLPDVVETLAEMLAPDGLCASGTLPSAGFGAGLGTIGGGNHFAEICRVVAVHDATAADELGLASGRLALLCHSGSRGLGKAIAEAWGNRVLADSDIYDYLADLAGAIRFARANRLLLAWRLLRALGVNRTSKLGGAFDVVHNDVRREAWRSEELWIHRKGCAPAYDGQMTAVLGSRGAPSWIMRGLGNQDGLCSVAHGAGRKMRRGEARAKLRARYRRSQLVKSPQGGEVICDDPKLLYEEHPDVYKPIEPVVASLEQAGLASRVAAVSALLTVKK